MASWVMQAPGFEKERLLGIKKGNDVDHLFINCMTPNGLVDCFSNYVAYIAHNAT